MPRRHRRPGRVWHRIHHPPLPRRPPTADELTAVLARLGLELWDLIRTTEKPAAALHSLPKDAAHRANWIAAMVANPILIQRPIITTDDNTTVIARVPESLTEIRNP